MQLPDGDTHFPRRRVLYQGEKLLKTIPHIRGWDVALDVGAHVGLWTVHLAMYFGEVHCFEPNKENYRCLLNNTQDMNVKLYAVALGDKRGEASQHNPAPGNSGAWETTFGGGDIPVRTIDEYGLNPDIIKIDTQGHEEEIIRGGWGTINRSRPVVIAETQSEVLKEVGMKKVWADDKDSIWAW